MTEAVSHLGEGVLITSDKLDWPGPHIVFVNDAMCQITGYTAEELIGQSPRVLQGDDSHRETLDRIKAELSAGRSVLAEVINYRKDSTPYDAELFITPLFNAEGRRTNFVSVHRDITERKRAENLLRQERNRAQQYLDVSGVIMVALDSQGDITLINRKGCEVFGCDEHELLGKNWFDTCLPEGSRNDVRSIFQQIMNGTVANAEYFENSVLTRTGEERVVEWHNTDIRDETGRVIGVLASGNDITGRRQAERALRDREERMRAILNTAADAIITIDRRGIDLVKRIRARHPKMKMLVNSMYDESVYAERSLQAGALGYLCKQTARETLIDAIRGVLSGKTYLSPEMTDRIVKSRVSGMIEPGKSPVESLSNRELEVLTLIGQGNTSGNIAKQLHLSIHTIDTYREKLKIKLNLANGAELNRYAAQWVLEHG